MDAYELEGARLWEEQNKTGREVYPEWENAIEKLRLAQESLKEAIDVLNEAAGMVQDSADDDRIKSLADEIGFLSKDLAKQTERMAAA